MSIAFQCDQCGRKYTTSDEWAGRTVHCKQCGRSLLIPAAPATDIGYDLDPEPMAPPRPGGPLRNPYDAPRAPLLSSRSSGQATASLVLGAIGMIGWCLPIIGFPVCIAGLITGGRSLSGPGRGKAIVGLVLSGVGLLLSIANAMLGAYLASRGQHPLVPR